MPVGNLVAPPEWMSDDQKANWTYAIANVPPALLTRLDASVPTAWTVAVDLHRQATLAQATVGLLVKIRTRGSAGGDGGGVPTASPYLNIITQQAKIILKSAGELGFTPVSRRRIEVGRSAPGHFSLSGNEPANIRTPEPVSLAECFAAMPPRVKLN